MLNKISSTDVLDDRIEPVQSKGKSRSYVRERFDGPMTEREAKMLELEERLRDLGAQLEELEARASRNYRQALRPRSRRSRGLSLTSCRYIPAEAQRLVFFFTAQTGTFVTPAMLELLQSAGRPPDFLVPPRVFLPPALHVEVGAHHAQ